MHFIISVIFVLNLLAHITEDNSNAPNRMASVQGTPEQVKQVTKTIQEIIEQVIMNNYETLIY